MDSGANDARRYFVLDMSAITTAIEGEVTTTEGMETEMEVDRTIETIAVARFIDRISCDCAWITKLTAKEWDG